MCVISLEGEESASNAWSLAVLQGADARREKKKKKREKRKKKYSASMKKWRGRLS